MFSLLSLLAYIIMMVILSIPIAFSFASIAKRFSKNETFWFLLGLIPILNIYLLIYILLDKILDCNDKLDLLLKLINQKENNKK
jgi:hypothetical protein